jgi:integrase
VLKVLDAWLAVARFVYRQELALVGWKHEERVPEIAALRQFMRFMRKTAVNLKAHKSISDTLEKRLEWTEFLELSEKLRLECRLWFPQKTQSKQGGTTRGGVRSLTAISQSYQRFLCVAFLAYLLPRRQKELRELKVSFFSDSGLQPDTNHVSSEGNLLFRKGKQWWTKLGADTKFGCRLDDSILVPNLRYADGRCFYQYLEEWLLQYDYQADPNKPVTVPGLRSCFQPQHDYLFTQQNGQPYSSASAFMALLRNPAYRLTGKALTPHTVRSMFATHIRKTQDRGQLNLPHVARQWAAEIAQAFIDEKAKGETSPEKAVSESCPLP